MRPGDQPLPTKHDGAYIQDLVIADIERRRQLGIERYGTALQAHNGRNSLRDLYEELIDGCMYVRQKLEEQEGELLTFDGYQDGAATTAVYPGQGEFTGLLYVALGAAGEAGEIANKVKKLLRGDADLTDDARAGIAKEIGGTLWYLAMLATELGLDLGGIAQQNLDILASRMERGVIRGEGDDR